MYGLYQILYFTIIDIFNTLKSPFFILILFIILIQYYNIGKIEEENFGYRKSALVRLITSIFWGILGGIITTVAFIYLGVVAIPKDFLYILVIAIILSIFNPRYMCFSYGGSIVSLMSLLFGHPRIQVTQVMSIVAVLHIVESILILLDGNSGQSPTYLDLNGEIVGGYNMNRFWPIPFVIFIGDGLIQPITLMAILNYGDFSITSHPRRKVVKTSLILFTYSLILLYISKTVKNAFLPPIFALVGHEIIILQNKLIEEKKTPIFPLPNRGVRVLGMLPNSIAKKIGVRKGDIILKINGVEINNKRDIDDIMRVQASSWKLELFNIKVGLCRKEYYGKKKNLGLVIVPREIS